MKASKVVWVSCASIALGLLWIAPACSANDSASSKGSGAGSSGSNTDGDSAKNDPGGSATETNVAGIHCFTDADCGPGGTCVPNPGQDDGACSGGPSSGPVHPGQGDEEDAGAAIGPNTHGLAAKCDVDSDCGGVKCLHPNGADQPGVCDVQQMGAR